MTDDETPAESKKLRHMLAWATFLAFVALAVLGLDLMIKRQILDAAKQADDRLGQLRRETSGRSPGQETGSQDQDPGSSGGPAIHGVDGVGDDPRPPETRRDNAGRFARKESEPAGSNPDGM